MSSSAVTGAWLPGTHQVHPTDAQPAARPTPGQIYGQIFSLSLPLCKAERITPGVFAGCAPSLVMFPLRGTSLATHHRPAERRLKMSKTPYHSPLQSQRAVCSLILSLGVVFRPEVEPAVITALCFPNASEESV